MKLARLILEHLIPSTIIGLLAWYVTGDQALVAIALLTGWLIDADHLLDLLLDRHRAGNRDSLSEIVMTGSYFKRNDKIIVMLHSWELIVLWISGWWFWGRPDIGITGGVSWIVHLLIDQNSYSLSPWAYFLSYRLTHGFDLRSICKGAA